MNMLNIASITPSLIPIRNPKKISQPDASHLYFVLRLTRAVY